jgi:hypothetical protein
MSKRNRRHERNGTPETPEAQTAAEEAQVEAAATPPEEAEVSPAPETQPAVLTHEPSGEVCRIADHRDGHGPCQRCRHCRVKIRPQHMDYPCPARA